MQYGIHIFPTEQSIQPDELARQVEGHGFDSVWFSEHTHIPVDFLKNSERGPHLPDHYWQTYDPFVVSTAAAIASDSILIGTGISLILQHDPIALAKTIATLDHMTGQRFVFGVGAGWLADEMANHGVNYATRYRRIHETMSAIKTIWADEEATFHGEFINFDAIKAFPKPLTKPHPPIIAGGGPGPKSLEFVAAHCDGWMPILGIPEWDAIKPGITDLRQRLEANGRDADEVALSVFVWELPDEQTIAKMEEAGIKRIAISIGSMSRDKALQRLDDLAYLNG